MDERTRALQAASTAAVLSGACDPADDLAAERARARAACGPVPEAWEASVRALLQPDAGARGRHARLVGWMRSDARFVRFKRARPFLEQDRGALYATVLELQALMVAQTHAWAAEGVEQDVYAGLRAGLGVLGEPGGLDLHYGMFGPTVAGLGTDAQRRAWGDPAQGLALVGTYAQTELGHGTHLRGLETTCTVDGDECVVHSPRLASIKWWPGGLGKTATHAAVMARVFLGPSGAEVPGIHPVIVPLRDVGSHAPLPGVELGDVGPKLGYNSIDNGFLRLDHVRVPRANLLSRFLPGAGGGEGEDAKVSYMTMVLIRAQLVGDASRYLQKATCIAVRYNLVRRQGGADPRDGQASAPRERALLDYPASQADLLPLVAAAYALAFASQAVERQYAAFSGGAVGVAADLSLLPELHATSAGLKAVATAAALDGIERCRRACGGHGFSNLSALPTLYGNYAPQVTYEGDNTVLLLQVARALAKARARAPSARAPALVPALALARGEHVTQASALDLEALAGAMRRRALHCVEAARREEACPPAGAEGGFDGAQAAWVRAAQAHVEAFLVRTFLARVADAEAGASPAAPGVRLLGALYAWDLLVGTGRPGMGDLLESGACDAAQAVHARAALRFCLAAARPLAVLLVDGYGLDDFELNYSALGRFDGDVYRALYEGAKRAPWNASDTPPGYKEVLQPLLKHGLPHSKL